MEPGDLVSDRFEIEAMAGAGGMGMVYRAIDRETGGRVALKVLGVSSPEALARFGREARLLADLKHPGIVGFVSHGETSAGERYLAMEWLDGEDLQERLSREGLRLGEAVGVVQRVAQALSVAHARGIVHRDVKPSNVFLVDRRVDRIKVLDFGIARQSTVLDTARNETSFGTSTGMLIGTLGYLAPEQALGAKDLGPQADVFSLGCVLFRCVTGRQPFAADDPTAMLAKILFEDSPRASELRPDIPPSLDDLIARMLAKQPSGRPSGASEVARELSELHDLEDTEAVTSLSSPAFALGTGERRLVSVVVAAPGDALGEEASDSSRSTAGEMAPRPTATEAEAAPTVLSADGTRVESHGGWRAVAASTFGARVERLADGVVVATLTESGAATDQAARAARLALMLRERWPAAPMALATGRSVLVHRLPVGDVIDRAVHLMRRAQAGPDGGGPRPEPGGDRERSVPIDDTTAGLLDDRFELGGGAGWLELRAEREVVESVRTLLGRTTTCVGREAELAILTRTYEECVEASQAQAVLVTGPSGVGKSRLRFELLGALREGAGGLPQPQTWIARGDPLSAGSPFVMLAQAIRRVASIRQGEPLVLRQQKLRVRLARYLEGPVLEHAAEFLGELIGAPLPAGEGSVQLQAARHDPVLMGDQRRRALEDWLAAEATHEPVLVVLEDLQWGDLPSVTFLDAALRILREEPFMVLAVARPEVRDLFPRLWEERRVQEIRLGELGRRSAERLVRQTLGPEAASATVQRIVELGAGNALYLEELIRAVAEGRGEDLPETVLAMVQARLEALEAEARQILRAASVFGGVFWRGGLLALLGGAQRTIELDEWLAILVDRELLTRRTDSRFPGQQELTFRHALVREAAYEMLTDEDRVLGHRLAAEWLERTGEEDALVLAEHHERARTPALACRWYERAAVDALDGNDFRASLTRAEQAIACGAAGEAKGAMRLVQSRAHGLAGEHSRAASRGTEAMSMLPAGGEPWFAAAAQVSAASGTLGDLPGLRAVADEVVRHAARIGGGTMPAIATARAASHLLLRSDKDSAERLLSLLDAIGPSWAADPGASAWVAAARGIHAWLAGDAGRYLLMAKEEVACFRRAGDLRHTCHALLAVGFAAIEAGAHAEADSALREALASAERMGLEVTAAGARQNLGLVRARQGALEEARALENDALQAYRVQGDRRMQGACLVYLALIELGASRLPAALEAARGAAAVLEDVPAGQAYAFGVLARVELARGETTAALAAAERAMRLLERLGSVGEGEAAIRLAWAEALAAAGRAEEARAAFAAAEARLDARASLIRDAELRRSFLEEVPDNARTRESAAAARSGA